MSSAPSTFRLPCAAEAIYQGTGRGAGPRREFFMGKRRRSREAAFQVLFSTHFTNLDCLEATARVGMVAGEGIQPVDEFASQLLRIAEDHEAEIAGALDAALKQWTADRLNAPDRALLQLGTAEILFMDDVPGRVSINEYIELAKRYGDDKSPAFVNGVLDRILKEHEKAAAGDPHRGSP
ncbi:transcription antitermination factor NusB [Candidatus Poribacteria bacterium]|nr:transcription antitermination factor NusB [Candidatus Poribacteria bacterium]